MPVIIDKVNTNGFTTEHIKFGNGEKTLVILPGLSIQSVLNSAQAVAEHYSVFENDYTVYLFERRKELPERYSVYDMAEDTVNVIKALNLERICLFGVSQGGMIALTLTANHPEIVEKLAVGSTAACIREDCSSTVKEWISLAENKRAEDLYLSFGEKVYPESVFEQYKDWFSETAKTVTDEELERFVILAKATEGFDILDKLSLINCPVLAIGDRQDNVLGVFATEEIAERLKGNPQSELFIYNGFGHAAYDTAPDYVERLYEFFG